LFFFFLQVSFLSRSRINQGCWIGEDLFPSSFPSFFFFPFLVVQFFPEFPPGAVPWVPAVCAGQGRSDCPFSTTLFCFFFFLSDLRGAFSSFASQVSSGFACYFSCTRPERRPGLMSPPAFFPTITFEFYEEKAALHPLGMSISFFPPFLSVLFFLSLPEPSFPLLSLWLPSFFFFPQQDRPFFFFALWAAHQVSSGCNTTFCFFHRGRPPSLLAGVSLHHAFRRFRSSKRVFPRLLRCLLRFAPLPRERWVFPSWYDSSDLSPFGIFF